MSVAALKNDPHTSIAMGEILPFAGAHAVLADATAPWSSFAECVLDATSEYIELRAIKPEGGPADTPLRSRDLSAMTEFCVKHNGVNHIYVGAATRTQSGGTKDHCREAIWTWADIDFKDFDGGENEALGRLTHFPHAPSWIVRTGGGLHCYWLLTAKVDLQKSAKPFEEALRRIAHNLGADTSRTELASMMRMPGTTNMKPERHGYVTSIETMGPSLKYELAAFLALSPPPADVDAPLEKLATAIIKGNRDSGALAYVNAVIKRHGPDTDDERLLHEVTTLLHQAGGGGLDAIIAKVPGWIKTAHALFDGGGKSTPLVLADAISAFYGGLVVCVGEQLRLYQDGYWALANEPSLRRQIADLDRPHTSPTRTTQTLQNLKDLTVEPNFVSRSDLICLANGALDPETGSLHVHSPAHRLVNRLSVAWEPEAPCDLWLTTLAEVFAGDPDATAKIDLLQMWFGYCLVPDTRYHKFLWLVGAGANGKSVILHMLEAVVGSHNTSNMMLTRIGSNFVRASLQDKLINISPEMRAEDTVADGLLKAIVAGDMIEAEIKYGPSFSFKSTVRVVAATNELPRLLDPSEGFRRRVMIIRFHRVFAENEQDRDRIQNLLLELPGMFHWAVEGLQKLRQQDGFVIPPSSTTAVEEYLRDADPVRQFVEDDLVEDPTGGLTPKVLYTRYDAWAKDRGFKTMNISTFGRRLNALGLKHRHSNGKKLWCVDFCADANVAWLTSAPKVGQVEQVEAYSNEL